MKGGEALLCGEMKSFSFIFCFISFAFMQRSEKEEQWMIDMTYPTFSSSFLHQLYFFWIKDWCAVEATFTQKQP